MAGTPLRAMRETPVLWPGATGAGSVTDAPIDESIPYSTRQSGAARHFGFFPFFAKKPWPVVQRYIGHYTRPGEVVCDPFAGSGVTPVEALVLGRRAVASDINPVARFITRATALAPVDLGALQAAYDRVRDGVQARIEALDAMSDSEVAALLQTLAYPRNQIPLSVRRAGLDTVDRLHTPRQLAGLALLREAIDRVGEPDLRDLLRVALANTVRYCNVTYALPYEGGRRRAPYRGNANFLRRFSFSPASPRQFYEHRAWPTFELRYQAVVDAKAETNRLIDGRYSPESFALVDLPAARIHEATGEARVDYCFTDPPYSNDINFLDLSVLWAAWLGLEISQENRREELLLRGTQPQAREHFERQFAAAAESMARALKPDRWLTLVYKHRDLSLWQSIIRACETSGLHYVNAVWQDLRIPSTRQIESPNINPTGDMYLNFRRMSPARFAAIYGEPSALDLPTRANYVEHEVERLVVAYLGATIDLIAPTVIQQLLDSRAFSNYRDDPQAVTQDLEVVLRGRRFTTWAPDGGATYYVMAPHTRLDPSLDPTDRARYYLFELLRERGQVTEGQASQALLTQFAQEPADAVVATDPKVFLPTLAEEVAPHAWRFAPAKVTAYKQLRLFFRRSRADELRASMERRAGARPEPEPPPLRPSLDGIALLRERLAGANAENPRAAAHIERLLEVLHTVLFRLQTTYADRIQLVQAVGDWATQGIDLRNASWEELLLEIVLQGEERPFALYRQIAQDVFADLEDNGLFLQFTLLTLTEWQHTRSAARALGRDELARGVPLLLRA